MSKNSIIGAFKWINNEKGFGLLSNGADDFFFHISNAKSSDLELTLSDYYLFERGCDQKKDRLIALNVEVISEPTFDDIQTLLNQGSYEVRVRGKVGYKKENILKSFLFKLINAHTKESLAEQVSKLIGFYASRREELKIIVFIDSLFTQFGRKNRDNLKSYGKDDVQYLIDSLKANVSKRVSIILWKIKFHYLSADTVGLKIQKPDESLTNLRFSNQDLIDNVDLLDRIDVVRLCEVKELEPETINKLKSEIELPFDDNLYKYLKRLYKATKDGFLGEVEEILAGNNLETIDEKAFFKKQILSLIDKANSTRSRKKPFGVREPELEMFDVEYFEKLISLIENDISDKERVALWSNGYYELKKNLFSGFDSSRHEQTFDLNLLVKHPERVDLKKVRNTWIDNGKSELIIQVVKNKYTSSVTYEEALELCELTLKVHDISSWLYEFLKDKVSETVVFKLWKEGKFIFDTDAGDILYKPDGQYWAGKVFIQKDVLLSHTDEIGIAELKRIKAFSKRNDGGTTLTSVLEKIIRKGSYSFSIASVLNLLEGLSENFTKAIVSQLFKQDSKAVLKQLIYYENIEERLKHSFNGIIDLGDHEEKQKRLLSLLNELKKPIPNQNLVSILSGLKEDNFESFLKSYSFEISDAQLLESIRSNPTEAKIDTILKYWKFENGVRTNKLITDYRTYSMLPNAFKDELAEKIHSFSPIESFQIHKATGYSLNNEAIFELLPFQSNRDKLEALQEFGNKKVLNRILKNWDFRDSKSTQEVLKLLTPNEIQSNKEFIDKLVESLEKKGLNDVIEVYKELKSKPLLNLLENKISSDNYEHALGVDDQVDELLKQWFSEGLFSFKVKEVITILRNSEKNGILLLKHQFSDWIGSLNEARFEELFEYQNYSLLEELEYIDFDQSLLSAIEAGMTNKQLLVVIQKINNSLLQKHAFSALNIGEEELRRERYKEIDEIGFQSDSINYLDSNDLYTGVHYSILECIHQLEDVNGLKEEILRALIKTIRYLPKATISVAKQKVPELLNELLNEVELNQFNFAVVAKLLLSKDVFSNKENVKEDTDCGILIEFLIDPTSEKNVGLMNNLLKTRFYSFQLLLYKLLTAQFYKDKLSRDVYYQLLSDIKGIQLSALLFKLMVLYPSSDRQQMMTKMNKTLKKHFSLMEREGLNKQIYEQVFSLSELVNMCDGRKSLDGNFWNEGGIQRYYVNDEDNLTYSNNGIEDIYCEGRFWRKTPIYNSDTNRSMGKNCDVYWCRNKVCMGVNDNTHFDKSFEHWTLNDVNKLFNIGLDQLAFSHIAGWLNRMNSIFDSLSCRSCNNLLRPLNFVPNQLGYYAVPLFQCVNQSCEKFEIKIRFTHCRGCGKILDSRDCHTCSECNWLICDDDQCGKCGCGADHQPRVPQY